MDAVRLQTQKCLTQRLVLATLTGRSLHISQIRPDSTDPGLAAHEISFLRLLESVTNGSHIEISYTGTTLFYRPGLITGSVSGGSSVIRHEVSAENTRGISYFLLPLCLLAPFSKAPLSVSFHGPGVITSATETGDISADSVRTAILPLYARFGMTNNIELRILARSNAGPGGKGGAGEVHLLFGHQIRLPQTVHVLDPGKIKKIRGVAYAIGLSGSNNARMIDQARGILNPLTLDTYIFSDVSAAPMVEKRKIGIGFGLSLVAESSTGSLFSADAVSPAAGGMTPEDVGRQCAYELLETISLGGTASPVAAPTMLLMMAMGSQDVGRLQLGRGVIGSAAVVDLARDCKTFGCSAWGLREATSGREGDVVVSIVGRGIGNIGRKVA